jgi:hypothetical protein
MMINTHRDPFIRLLREALPPIADTATAGDLWPLVQSRLIPGAPPPSRLEWILVAAVMLACALQPAALSLVLFHF